MSGRHVMWKSSAQIFLLNRLLILCITVVCLLVLPAWIPGYLASISADASAYHILPSPTLNLLLFSWLHWDAKAYLNISYQGYHYQPDAGFFPLWPFVQHLGGVLLGARFPVSYYLSGLLLANLFFYFDLVMLHHLISKEYGSAVARRLLFYFSFSPFGLFFFAGYNESLFVLLALGMFLSLRRGHRYDWWLAGLCGLLATLTRSAGLMLAIPFLAIYFQRFWRPSQIQQHSWREKLGAGIPVIFIPIGLLIYMAYLYFVTGNALLFLNEEHAIWHRQLTFPPFTLWLAAQSFAHEPSLVFQVENLMNLIAVLLPFALLIRGWRSLPLRYTLFVLSTALFSLSFPTMIAQSEPLLSQPRYMMTLFPITLILAQWGKNPRFDTIFRLLTLLAFTLSVALFVSNIWVA